ncbi:hypothetical protein CXB51_002985 [Gossypium anomalum]|uniref:Integrase catalytic domain-containing protein n=1 Tax=Gossypium anomalum TaxID=47600 RepID=A0A8J5ZP41_9ROSI|nr:hypothetical protein CXB51_002985 [Gossypium anomalum]
MVSLTETPLQANLTSRSQQDSTDNSGHSSSSNRGQRGQGRGWSRGQACGGGRSWSRFRPQCQLCGKMGHMVQTCYHRFDENFSGVGLGNSVQAWYPDSGATNHIIPNLSNITAASPYTAGSRLLRLRSVPHVPNDIQTGTTLLVGHMYNGLYRFDVSHAAPSNKTSTRLVDAHNFNSALLNSAQLTVKVQFGCSIRMLQSDGGGEYRALSGELSHLGIQHQISCPHTSEQNGVAERKHRQVVDMGLTLLAQASIPLQFWSYAFAHAVHLFNRLPTPILQQCNPYEKLYNLKPSVGSNQKGYKCLDADGHIFISRYVVFDESYYPFANGFCPRSSLTSIQSDHQQSHLPRVLPPDSCTHVLSASSGSSSCPSQAESPLGSCASALLSSSSGLHGESLPTVSTPSLVPRSATIVSAPSLVPQSAASSQAPVPVNFHPMQTRSKSGIYRPKTAAAQDEYNALLSNHTWDLVPLPEVVGRLAEVSVDFWETFSPIIKPTTIRVVLALAISFGWTLWQVGINNAFLDGDLHEEIYIMQPPGFEQQGVSGQQLAPWAWFHKLKEFLLDSNFTGSRADNSLFVYHSGSTLVYVLVYVDEIIITGNDSQAIDRFVHDLNARFSLKDLGRLNYFLGIEVTYAKGGVFLSQKKYILELLQKASIDRSNDTPTPMTTTCKLSTTKGSPIADAYLYRSIVGALQYVVITRPEITFSVNKFLLEGFSDASWGSDTDDRQSTSGFCIFLGAEAEYRSLAHVTAEMIWIQFLLFELFAPKTKELVWYDSTAAVAVAGNPVMHAKFKHVELDLFFMREKVTSGVLQVGHVSSQYQIADILTKPLSEVMFTKFRTQLRVVNKA